MHLGCAGSGEDATDRALDPYAYNEIESEVGAQFLKDREVIEKLLPV